ncbi:MAG: hypothetical protein CL678_17210 [Bdellovibrionaceae bacterium]|nr:hypothetical protein [Pseudobdellovibrionaceae bacterium]|tara:strand:- start:5438 stop:6262 length:825 start_codon:yes stop_codon:yes gene_type:complete
MTEILRIYQELGDRNFSLFTEFLPKGYELTTLSSVDRQFYKSVIETKIKLGILITVLDDLADRPDRYSPEVLHTAYRLDLNDQVQSHGPEIQFIQMLLREISEEIENLPFGAKYRSHLFFDLQHFYLANRMAELLTCDFDSVGSSEYLELSSYNMGIVAAGMIDLMGSSQLIEKEVGVCREVFRCAQRVARISNVLSTEEREVKEGDMTNEIYFRFQREKVSKESIRESLNQEFSDRLKQFRLIGREIKTFSVDQYANGISKLHELHLQMKGKI